MTTVTKTKPSTPSEYFEAIRHLRTPKEIKAVCDQLTSRLFNETDKAKTRANKLSPYNKVINTIPNHELVEDENAYIQTRADGSFWKRHLHFKFTGLADTNWNGEGGINNKTVVMTRLENKREIPVNEYLETVKKLLQSEDFYDLALGLIATSGRRPIEILARGNFTLEKTLPDNLKPGYFVRFAGQVKKRDYDAKKDEKPEYRIGVLVPADYFLKQFKRFRAMSEAIAIAEFLKTETEKGTAQETINEKIDDRAGRSLRRVVSANFTFIPTREGEIEVNNKSLRAMYCALITERDCPKNTDKLLWASRAVGHFVDTEKVNDNDLKALLTTLGYSDFYVSSEVPFVEIETPKRTSARIESDDLAQIKEIQKELNLPNIQETVSTLIDSYRNRETMTNELLELREQVRQLQAEKAELERKLEEFQNNNTVKVREYKNAETMTNQQLWETRMKGSAEEKVRRSYQAVTTYNDTLATGDSDRIAITNQVLRGLSGANPNDVSEWIQTHLDEVISHNAKYGMENKKDPSNPMTFFNKKIGKERETEILRLINQKFLDGVAKI